MQDIGNINRKLIQKPTGGFTSTETGTTPSDNTRVVTPSLSAFTVQRPEIREASAEGFTPFGTMQLTPNSAIYISTRDFMKLGIEVPKEYENSSGVWVLTDNLGKYKIIKPGEYLWGFGGNDDPDDVIMYNRGGTRTKLFDGATYTFYNGPDSTPIPLEVRDYGNNLIQGVADTKNSLVWDKDYESFKNKNSDYINWLLDYSPEGKSYKLRDWNTNHLDLVKYRDLLLDGYIIGLYNQMAKLHGAPTKDVGSYNVDLGDAVRHTAYLDVRKAYEDKADKMNVAHTDETPTEELIEKTYTRPLSSLGLAFTLAGMSHGDQAAELVKNGVRLVFYYGPKRIYESFLYDPNKSYILNWFDWRIGTLSGAAKMFNGALSATGAPITGYVGEENLAPVMSYFDPGKYAAWIRSGFAYAPHNPLNQGWYDYHFGLSDKAAEDATEIGTAAMAAASGAAGKAAAKRMSPTVQRFSNWFANEAKYLGNVANHKWTSWMGRSSAAVDRLVNERLAALDASTKLPTGLDTKTRDFLTELHLEYLKEHALNPFVDETPYLHRIEDFGKQNGLNYKLISDAGMYVTDVSNELWHFLNKYDFETYLLNLKTKSPGESLASSLKTSAEYIYPANWGTSIFRKPLSIEKLKLQIRDLHAEAIEELRNEGIYSEEYLQKLPEESPGMKHLIELEKTSERFGINDGTVLGYRNDGKGGYSGWIVGKKSNPDNAAMEMALKVASLEERGLSLERILEISQAITEKLNNAEPTYLYYADEPSNIYGYHSYLDNGSFSNLREIPNLQKVKATNNHENVSHLTDDVVGHEVLKIYKDGVDALQDGEQFLISNSKNWYELRSTMHDLREIMDPDGTVDSFIEKVLKTPPEELAGYLQKSNGYGWDYGNAILKNHEKAKIIKDVVKLPSAILATYLGLSAMDDEEDKVSVRKHGGLLLCPTDIEQNLDYIKYFW